jgi:hypothetical protein
MRRDNWITNFRLFFLFQLQALKVSKGRRCWEWRDFMKLFFQGKSLRVVALPRA